MPTEPIVGLADIAELMLSCLCEAASGRANPPAQCCYRVGEEIAHDADAYTDLCCAGLAYVTVLDIYPVVDSFPEQSIVTQADWRCSIPSWAISLKAGIVRCAPTGGLSMPTCADWTAAAQQGFLDAQSLAQAACCFKQSWQSSRQGRGLSVVIGPNSTSTPLGGCVERNITMQVQTTVCPTC